MSPAAVLALIRDAAIVGALGFVIWRLVDFGEDRIKAQDVKAVQAQIEHNTQLQAQWQANAEKADAQRTQDMAALAARIDANSAPVLVRVPAYPRSLPGAASCPVVSGADSRPVDSGSGSDIRPAINAFEKRYEQALADCRAMRASWPTP